jgi:enoyl-CoA hydratase/carnithine racemase
MNTNDPPRVATVTLNRPERKNAIAFATWRTSATRSTLSRPIRHCELSC